MNYEIIVRYNSTTRDFTFDESQVLYGNSYMVDNLVVIAKLGGSQKMYVVFENVETGAKTKNVSLVARNNDEYSCVIPSEVLKTDKDTVILAYITVYEMSGDMTILTRTTNNVLSVSLLKAKTTNEVEKIDDDARVLTIENNLKVIVENVENSINEIEESVENSISEIEETINDSVKNIENIEKNVSSISEDLNSKMDTSYANERFAYNENRINAILDGASVDLDTFKEVAEYFNQNGEVIAQVTKKVGKAEEDVAKALEEVAKANETSNKALQMAQGGLSYKVNDEEVTFDGEINLQGGEKIDLVKIDNTVFFSYNPDKVMLPVGMPKGAKLVDYGVNSYHIKNGKLYIDVAKIPTDDTKTYLYINGSDYDSDGYEEEGASLTISAGYTGYFGSLYVFDSNSMTGVPVDMSKAVMEIDISQLGWSGSDIVTSARNNDAIYYVPNE